MYSVRVGFQWQSTPRPPHRRRRLGRELARRAGISRPLLSRIEHGQVSPSVETLPRVANGLGVPMSRFFPLEALRKHADYLALVYARCA
ncbi:helix-turn-helix domain-containing protein [Variovorax paradoxus]|uniref:helix-turn-helix domain-containing protein n=1 Tax=Variovorax paradoxus TaxID=34073 RepID=UPI0009B79102